MDKSKLNELALAATGWESPAPYDEDRCYSDREVAGLNFNAAANPAVILELLAEIERLEATRPSVDLSGLKRYEPAQCGGSMDVMDADEIGLNPDTEYVKLTDVQSLLATKAAEAVQPSGQPPIGRMMDEFSSLPILWGLNEPGALVRHSDVFKMLVAAGKTDLAAPALDSAPQADEQSSMAGAARQGGADEAILARQVADWTKERDRLQDLIDTAAPVAPQAERAAVPEVVRRAVDVMEGLEGKELPGALPSRIAKLRAAVMAYEAAAPVAQEGEQSGREHGGKTAETRMDAGFGAGREQVEQGSVQAGLFQQRVQPWMMACFGAEISADCAERNHRFFEEAAELTQACGMSASEAHQLVDYVWGRPIGEKYQEVGGVMVTLAALCLAQGLDMHQCGETELARIWAKVEQIRAKQAAKPKHSPLPITPAASSQSVDTPELRERFKYMLWDEYAELVAHLDSLIAAQVAGVRKDALEEAALLVETNELNSAAFNAAEIRALTHSPTTPADDSVRKDAERYRWLRQFGYQAWELVFHDDGTLKWGEELDHAIDAALSAHSPATSSKES